MAWKSNKLLRAHYSKGKPFKRDQKGNWMDMIGGCFQGSILIRIHIILYRYMLWSFMEQLPCRIYSSLLSRSTSILKDT